MQDPLAFMVSLAEEVGGLLTSFFGRGSLYTEIKGDRSIVTEADLAADRLIGERIAQGFPGETIISEELHADHSQDDGDLSAVWVIDPLDGTTNFRLGLPIWGVSLARCLKGRPAQAVVYFPLLGELYTAQAGGGARLNGALIRTLPPNPALPASFFTCCSRTHRRYTVTVPYKTRILGSTAYSLCCVARGAALVGFDATPKLWDLAGGWLALAEAGGSIEPFDQAPVFPIEPRQNHTRRNHPIVFAATPELVGKARQWIAPKQPAA
jgi:myo-inositol-1(or 4)-monophosphatase